MPRHSKKSKQLTLDNLAVTQKQEPTESTDADKEKHIVITEISSSTAEDELVLNVRFKLLPSKNSFSKVHSDLWFDKRPIISVSLRIPQGPLATDESEYTTILDMKGIPSGTHKVTVEMYELWSPDEKLNRTIKDVSIDYVPQTRESRFVKVPNVKSVAGKDLAVVSESEKEVYRKIEKTMKKEQLSKRDDW